MTIKSKACWLFLLVAVLMTALLPQPSLAQERELDLTLTLLPGRYPYYNEVKAGEDNTFFLEVRNTGSKAITNIRLSSDKPEGWVIEFEPQKLDYLGPGSLQTINVNIKPVPKVVEGEYRVTFIAEANEILRVESTSWVTVKTASPWPWIGAGIVLVVVAAFIFIFRRYGR